MVQSNVDIGRRLLYYLNVKGISQKDFAKTCHINETTMSRYISGEREPKIKTVMAMAYTIGVSVDDLVDMDEYIKTRYMQEM